MLKATWDLRAVLSVHILRLAVGILIVRLVYPLFFKASPLVIELTDRLIVLALVLWKVRDTRGDLRALGLSLNNWGRNIVKGLAGGLALLFISLYSERLYTTVLLVSPTQHPIVAQVQAAWSWQQLVIPLFLAGIAAPVTEEMLYRLFTFLPLKDKWGLWGGALFSAAIFALFHFNAYWLVEMIIVGIGFALLYFWTGSLITSITAHSFINTSKIVMMYLGVPLI
ncbi:type II CAAX endopeptidase family protein [Sporomusa sp.]|uniref:CPBP family intramembrane glutamic endopeptidase n=1 Tax=Sporomusa sp. TaxID=2078658 RepID=UPI002B68476D|nr:type II CAAX endopeptidase family protein [Sporomusa sp.]HWR45569.1 type II CAAX endopeptidase family protein [Sporomusa sp.]